MAIAIIYKKIIDLQIWHDYYLGQPDALTALSADYDSSNLLTIEPTPDCLQSLKNLRWVFRSQPHGASIFASVNKTITGEFQTQIPIDRLERLTFWLVVRDPDFMNFTNLPLEQTAAKIYYYSNLTGSEASSLLFLTQLLPTYDTKTEYTLGQLVAQGGKTQEAIKYQKSSPKNFNQKQWQDLPSSQYVSALDYLPRQALSRSDLALANPGDTVRVKLVDINEVETFAVELIAPNQHPPGSPLAIDLNFTGQDPGLYQLTRNGREVEKFVLIDPLPRRDVFGLVEISLNSSRLTPAFALIEPNAGQTLIRPKTYVIRFKNRLTRWRYNYEHPHGFKSRDLPEFNWIDDKTYATKQLFGLRSPPSTNLLKDGKDRPLPSSSATLIKPKINNDRQIDTIFSDIYL